MLNEKKSGFLPPQAGKKDRCCDREFLTALHAAEEVCAPVSHRQLVFTIPKRLRIHARFDRRLLGTLALVAWGCVRSQTCLLLGRDDLIPGLIAGILTLGELLNFHPYIHALVTCGAFTEAGAFVPLPAFDANALLRAWEEAVYDAEKPDCRAFPLLAGDGMRPGAKRSSRNRMSLNDSPPLMIRPLMIR